MPPETMADLLLEVRLGAQDIATALADLGALCERHDIRLEFHHRRLSDDPWQTLTAADLCEVRAVRMTLGDLEVPL